jgi:hypothetical protein
VKSSYDEDFTSVIEEDIKSHATKDADPTKEAYKPSKQVDDS